MKSPIAARAGRVGQVIRFPRWSLIAAICWLSALWPSLAEAQDPVDFFKKNCASCHTIGGGDLTGPDLKDVSKRQDRDWLLRFIQNPQSMISSGDPIATELKAKYKNVVMPTVPGMTRELAEKLLDLIDKESALEKSQFAGVQISMRPFTDRDRRQGRDLFLGTASLENRGPSCITCHDIAGAPGFGGGKLGPDLTQVFARLGGRKALSAWLVAPSTATMQPVFENQALTADEILALSAYFESTASQTPPGRAGARVAFLILGLLLAVAMIFLFDAIWKFRFRGVRTPLVEQAREKVRAA